MASESPITIMGSSTRDAELRYGASGKPVCNFGVAVNHRYQLNGEWTETVGFHNVVVFGPASENCAASVMKGTRVIVHGRLEQRSYEDREGNKRQVSEIVADDVGISLKWATAIVEKTERTKTDVSKKARAATAAEEDF